MKTSVEFLNENGQHMAAVLHTPDIESPKAYALFAHCFTCTKDIKAAVNIANSLANQNIATLRFDFSGLGASEGKFEESSFSTNIQDLISAASYLDNNYEAPQILIGHSLGGTAVLAAANKIPSVKAIATIGSPASPDHVLHVLDGHLEKLKQDGVAVVPLAGRPHTFKQAFVDDVKAHMTDYNKLGKALMVMHSPFDSIVSIDEATKIFGQSKHPKTFVSLDRADHLLSEKADAIYVGDIIANWAKRYIEPQIQDQSQVTEKIVIVEGETDQAFLNIAKAGVHKFIVDEPISYGGTNLGPTPYDYLAVALGSCTSMTLNGYARRKKLNVSKIAVRVEHDRIHAKDCDSCEKTDGKVDRFIRHIQIDGDITDEQHMRMLEIADLCPVHKTLENEIKVETRVSIS